MVFIKSKINDIILRNVEIIMKRLAKITGLSPLITITEEAVLNLLDDEISLPIHNIRSLLKIASDDLSYILRNLENYSEMGKGKTPLIDRHINPNDRRTRSVSITIAGKKILRKNSKVRKKRLEILVKPLNGEEIRLFSKILDKMGSSLEKPKK